MSLSLLQAQNIVAIIATSKNVIFFMILLFK
nr:MAG TPA: hypothetical protein [Caudoviricetes sp.]